LALALAAAGAAPVAGGVVCAFIAVIPATNANVAMIGNFITVILVKGKHNVTVKKARFG
jgi:hypothetical protein